MFDGTPRPRFRLWSCLPTASATDGYFHFADHDGVYFVLEGVIVVVSYAPIARSRLEDVILLHGHAYHSSRRDT
jgi:hypothetical protein